MPRERAGTRVLGPYARPNGKWRVVLKHPGREGANRREETFRDLETEAAAEVVARAWRAELLDGERTVGLAFGKFIDDLVANERAEATISAYRYAFDKMFPEPGEPLSKYQKFEACQAAYTRMRTSGADTERGTLATDSHRNALVMMRTFLRWCCKPAQRYITENGFKEVEGKGKRKKGKEQLNVPECRQLMSACIVRAYAGDQGAMATLALYLNMRTSEAARLRARDVEEYDDVMYLVINRSKTEHGVRDRLVPVRLRPLFRALAKGKAPEASLWDQTRNQTGPATAKVLDALLGAGGQTLDAAEVAKRTGVGHEVVQTLLYKLTKAGLVSRAARGQYLPAFKQGSSALERRAETPVDWAPDRHWVGKSFKRMCVEAGVPNVAPHSMRGMWARLRLRGGVDDMLHQALREIGHAPGSTRTLIGHYAGKGAEATVLEKNFWDVVDPVQVRGVGDEVE